MEIKDDILYVASHHNLLLIDLSSNSILESIYVTDSEYLGHIALDSLNYVYVADWSAQKLFRINLNNHTSTTLHTFSDVPAGVSYEESNNRIIVLVLVNNAPILAYNLTSGYIDTVRHTNINDPDAICRDATSNYYITSFVENIVYRFGYDFSSGPEIISTGHGGPSGIGYNGHDNILGVTNYNFNSIDFIQLEPSNTELEKNIELKDYILFQNYPNPFNPSTKIKYQIPDLPAGRQGLSFVSLKVYDVLGNEVFTLVNEEKPTGKHEVDFDASALTSGVYYYKIQAGNYVETKKMVLIK
jgi:hypothetical protein